MSKVCEEPGGSFLSFLVAMVVCLRYLLACFLPCVDCGPPLQTGGAVLAVRKSKGILVPLTEAQKQDLQRRLTAYEADHHAGSTWEEVKTRLREL